MFTVNCIDHKKILIGALVSASFYTINVYADNVVSCDTAENTAIIATTAHLTDNNDGTVTDSETGLIWKQCSEGQVWSPPVLIGNPPIFFASKCIGSTDGFSWQTALQRAQDVNTGTGENFSQTDWRLPNIRELASIAEFRCSDPVINKTVFPQTPSESFWSSSLGAPNSSTVWFIFFGNNGEEFTGSKNGSFSVRLVRSGQ